MLPPSSGETTGSIIKYGFVRSRLTPATRPRRLRPMKTPSVAGMKPEDPDTTNMASASGPGPKRHCTVQR